MLEEHKELNRRIRLLEEMAAEVEAQKLLSTASDGVVSKIFDGREVEWLKKLAHALIANPRTVALLATRDHDTARLVFARSTDAGGDMSALMREACALLEGRGGGKPELAQGGGKNVEKLDDALRHAAASLARP
jgi:alanyl-tRNA synthetase